jgi:Kef-type K+ transport system membrane component KefB
MAAELTPVAALVPAITLLGFGAAAALASKAMRLSPIVGYLIVGILIGPSVLGLIEESSATHLMAELGVVFLLFDIGMHVSLRELNESRKDLLRLAPMHLFLTGLCSAAAFAMLGMDWPIALAVGLSLGLSSTAGHPCTDFPGHNRDLPDDLCQFARRLRSRRAGSCRSRV